MPSLLNFHDLSKELRKNKKAKESQKHSIALQQLALNFFFSEIFNAYRTSKLISPLSSIVRMIEQNSLRSLRLRFSAVDSLN